MATSLTSFAGTPDNMQVWLKNGEHSVFDISQVDSVTFGVDQQQEHNLLMNFSLVITQPADTEGKKPQRLPRVKILEPS